MLNGCFKKLQIFRLSVFVYTVEPRYFELGQFEVPAISKEDRMPLDLPFPFTLPRLSRSPTISNFFSFP